LNPARAVDCCVYVRVSNLNHSTIKTEDFCEELQLNAYCATKVIQQALPALKKSDNAFNVMFQYCSRQKLALTFHTSFAMAKGALEGFGRAIGLQN